nr:uncharacterized protein LOC113723037 [Coffea arabica]
MYHLKVILQLTAKLLPFHLAQLLPTSSSMELPRTCMSRHLAGLVQDFLGHTAQPLFLGNNICMAVHHPSMAVDHLRNLSSFPLLSLAMVVEVVIHSFLPHGFYLKQYNCLWVSGGSGSSGSGNRVPVDDVVDKVTNMGFPRDQVRATVRKLTENGQSVDLNVVLDKLMNDGEVQPPRGWFGR